MLTRQGAPGREFFVLLEGTVEVVRDGKLAWLRNRCQASNSTEVADRLHSAAIHLLRRIRKVDEASGLSAARLSALSVLVFGGATTVGALARAEQVSAPTMSRLVSGLERDGFVRPRGSRGRRASRARARDTEGPPCARARS